ncbi:cell division protein SepF [Brassicibacter mesophilus]|uniref:cell division protein SepF n=1 Tax=Brassicibacter mesophilus TaxID=745119 RepID=UPI003D1ED53D
MADVTNKLIDKVKYIIGLDDLEEEYEEEQEESLEFEAPVKKGVIKNNKIVNIHTNSNIKLVVYEPQKYEEAPKIVDDLKIRKLIVMNLENLEIEIKKQIFDFINGAIYALDGNIQKVSKDIFVVAPSNVEIDAKLKEELKNKGLFPWQK